MSDTKYFVEIGTDEDPVHFLVPTIPQYDWRAQPDFKTVKPTKQGIMDRIELPEHPPTELFGTLHDGYINIPHDGYINIPSDGIYGFYTNSDDGSLLFIDGILVSDNGGRHWMQERVGFIALKMGMHAIRASWFNGAGCLGLEASWKGPGIEKEIIPASVLYH